MAHHLQGYVLWLCPLGHYSLSEFLKQLRFFSRQSNCISFNPHGHQRVFWKERETDIEEETTKGRGSRGGSLRGKLAAQTCSVRACEESVGLSEQLSLHPQGGRLYSPKKSRRLEATGSIADLVGPCHSLPIVLPVHQVDSQGLIPGNSTGWIKRGGGGTLALLKLQVSCNIEYRIAAKRQLKTNTLPCLAVWNADVFPLYWEAYTHMHHTRVHTHTIGASMF